MNSKLVFLIAFAILCTLLPSAQAQFACFTSAAGGTPVSDALATNKACIKYKSAATTPVYTYYASTSATGCVAVGTTSAFGGTGTSYCCETALCNSGITLTSMSALATLAFVAVVKMIH